MKTDLSPEKRATRGFTLVELLISVSIMGLITGIVVFNQGEFSDNIALSNVVNEMELQIREAQVYGTGVREFSPGTNEFDAAYGVSFNIGSAGASNSSYISFADRGLQNGYFNTPASCQPGPSSECIRVHNLTRNNIITDLCVIQSNNSTVCNPTVARVDITFNRPDPVAKIKFFNASGGVTNFVNHRGAQIEITSPKNKVMTIQVYTTGQIAII